MTSANSPLPAAEPPTWRRSSRCDGGQCLSIAVLDTRHVAIRNDAHPDTVIVATREEFSVLVAGWIGGEFASTPQASR